MHSDAATYRFLLAFGQRVTCGACSNRFRERRSSSRQAQIILPGQSTLASTCSALSRARPRTDYACHHPTESRPAPMQGSLRWRLSAGRARDTHPPDSLLAAFRH
jgi:hypothetical protein